MIKQVSTVINNKFKNNFKRKIITVLFKNY